MIEPKLSAKFQTSIMATPDEVLSTLADWNDRSAWDFGLKKAVLNGSHLELQYQNQSPFKVNYEFFFHNNQFYIIEYFRGQRHWILEQIKNRPYMMRVTVFAEGHEAEIRQMGKTIAALRNYIN